MSSSIGLFLLLLLCGLPNTTIHDTHRDTNGEENSYISGQTGGYIFMNCTVPSIAGA
jgi:hypothetical protein